MGTWSHEVFGNDVACDWVASLAQADSLQPIEASISAVVNAPAGLLDADAAVEGLAAAEALARLRGWPGRRSAYTQALDDWVLRTRLQPPAAWVQGALAALQRIGGPDSELRTLWEDGDSAAAWLSELSDLRQRLIADPRPPQVPPAADAAAHLVHRVLALRFELPRLPYTASVHAAYQQAVGGAALGDGAAVRDAIERLWQPVARLNKPAVAWDLAVRDAVTLAAEGRLDEALAGLEAWRGAPAADEPGMFAMRAAGLCQAAGDPERMRALRADALDQAPQQAMWRLDDPLYEARAGSADAAQVLLDALGDLRSDAAIGPVDDFIRGILACRRGDPAALPLLTPVAQGYVDQCAQGAAAWSLGSAAIGWRALALAQAGRPGDARAVVEALRPVLLQPHNALLVDGLRSAGMLPGDTGAPARPARIAFDGLPVCDHGPFRSVAVRGVNALRWVEAQRRRFAAGNGAYPFLIGDDEDLRQLLAMIAPPADGGRAVLDAAANVDAAAWLKQRTSRRKLAWPREGPGPHPTPLLQFHAVTQRLKPVQHVGLIDLSDPCELFARLGWGNWNDCPAPAVHVALHRAWRDRFGAEPVAVSSDIIECTVARPTADRDAALLLAREHAGYASDIVEQGTGTVARLGSSLLVAPYWYFWWD